MTTYTTQPNETDGIDSLIASVYPTNNFGTYAVVEVGCYSVDTSISRTLLKFDLSKGTNPPPANATVTSGTITLYLESETSSNAVTIDFYKCLRNWVEAQATWNVYSTGNNWGTAGCANTTTDRENTILAQGNLSATEAVGAKNYALNTDGLAVVQSWINGSANNYGFLFKASSEASATRFTFTSSSGTTTANRPKLVIEYISGGQFISWSSW